MTEPMTPFHHSGLVAEDRVERRSADLGGACDVGFASPSGVCEPCKTLNGSHGVGCLAFGMSATVAFDGDLGESGVGLHEAKRKVVDTGSLEA